MTAESILNQFDEAAKEFVFPMLDNGYVYPADVRLTIYRNDEDWLMIIEVVGAYSPRASGCGSFQNCLHLFGSRLNRKPGTKDDDFLYPVESHPDDSLFADVYDWNLRPEARALELRGKRVAFDPSIEALAAKGIKLIESPDIDPPAVLRSLLPEHRNLLLASDEELAERNPLGLPEWMRLDEWNHPDLADDVLPSQSETFIMLANCIATDHKAAYQPTLPPNTNWRNWPDGGTF